jgi:hypothetical protein
MARWVPVALLAWAVASVAGAPPSATHGAVVRLALAVSGRPVAYQRWELHRDHQRRRWPPAVVLPPG